MTNPTWPPTRSSARPVLVSYGGRGGSNDALALGMWLAASGGDRPVVVTVYPREPVTVLPGIGDDYVREMQDAARATQRSARAFLQTVPDHPATPAFKLVGAPSAAAGLDQVARRTDASMVVVGSSGRGAQRRVSTNQTATRIFAGSPVPVVIAPRGFGERAPDAPLDTVGCAFVPTKEGRHALRRAAALARRVGARLEVFTAAGPSAERAPERAGRRAQELIEQRAVLRGVLEQAVDGLPDDLTVTTRVLDGDPVSALSALEPDDCDVLVCGSRGYGPIKRTLLGGVSERLVRRAAVPVMIVPRSAGN